MLSHTPRVKNLPPELRPESLSHHNLTQVSDPPSRIAFQERLLRAAQAKSASQTVLLPTSSLPRCHHSVIHRPLPDRSHRPSPSDDDPRCARARVCDCPRVCRSVLLFGISHGRWCVCVWLPPSLPGATTSEPWLSNVCPMYAQRVCRKRSEKIHRWPGRPQAWRSGRLPAVCSAVPSARLGNPLPGRLCAWWANLNL